MVVDAETPLPLWSAITRGTLPNGLTYYVLPHREPKQRASLWLAVNAGSLQEDDDQQGLAHFVEHMAFNGTTKFPKQEIVDYLEKIGMAFGPHVNAYTSYDQTVYQLRVPTDDASFVVKGLEVLREWAGAVTFDPAEVDKERGVVLEEWRLGRGASSRIFDKQADTLFRGTRYAKRRTIGKSEIIQQAPRAALARYYRDWYRPDLMAVIVVGDVPAAEVEAMIASTFGDLPAPAAPRPRTTADAPVQQGTTVSIETDPELTQARVAIHNVFPRRGESTERDFRAAMIDALYHSMLRERLTSLSRGPEAPFVYASSSTGELTRQFEAFSRSAVAKDDQAEATLAALFAEVLRVEHHGFTATELERAKRNQLRAVQRRAAEADKQDAISYASDITQHFFEAEALLGPAGDLALWEKHLAGIQLAELNAAAREWGGASDRAILISGPAGAALPTRERVFEIIAAAEAGPLPPWIDTAPSGPLMGAAPATGRIVSEKRYPEVGITEWTLSNGARVVLKPTAFENDMLRISASSPGGLAAVSDADYPSGRVAAAAAAVGGLGQHSASNLEKMFAGSTATTGFWIGDVEEGMWGQAALADRESLFQLLHLGFTAPRKDSDAFTAWLAGQRTMLAKRDLKPETVFADEVQMALTLGHPRRKPMVAADLDRVDLDRALAVFHDRFGDVSDFTFTIVGSFDPPALRWYVETYLASLPARGRVERRIDVGVRNPIGLVETRVARGTEPKAAVSITFHGDQPWSMADEWDIEILAAALRTRLREILREELGGVYGVSVTGGVMRAPRQIRTLSIRFGCAPNNVVALRKAVFDEVERIKNFGVSQGYVDKIKAARKRQFETERRQNRWWQARLDEIYDFGDDPRQLLSIEPVLARITPEHIVASARRFLDTHRYLVGVLEPAPPTTRAAAAVAFP